MLFLLCITLRVSLGYHSSACLLSLYRVIIQIQVNVWHLVFEEISLQTHQILSANHRGAEFRERWINMRI